MEFNFDEREFRRQVEKAANDGLREMARDLQSTLDRVHHQHAGKPPDEVKRHLRTALRGKGDFKDRQLQEYAGAISEGRRIVIDPQRVRL
jgi:hypothetical protein